MIQKVFSIWDETAELYSQPIVSQNAGTAIRSFIKAVNDGDPTNNLGRFPHSFQLFEIGTWNDETGIIEMHEAKKALMGAHEALEKKEQ